MEKLIKFSGWTPSPNTVTIGMERDNKVFSLKFEGMPNYPNGTAYLHIDCGGNGADSIEVVDGTAEITRNVTQYEGEKEAYVEILADGDVVWHSDVIMVTVKRLPILGEKIEQEYPTAFEQALAQTAADKAAAAKSAADAKATAEGIVTEEAARQAAESKRVVAEQGRVEAEARREERIVELETEVAKKAQIDDTTVSDAAPWSSQHIVDMLCPPLEESGNPVVCYPVAGSKLGVKASWEPTQEGEGTPSPDNIRPISGRDSVMVERCGENLFDQSRITSTSASYGLTTQYATGKITISGIVSSTKEHLSFHFLELSYKLPPAAHFLMLGLSVSGCTSASVRYTDGSYRRLAIDIDGCTNGKKTEVSFYLVVYVGITPPVTYTPYTGSTTTLTIPSTVYGGEVGADGDGQETWGYIETYAGEALPAEWICDRAVYAEGDTPPTGAQVAYKLITPIPFTTTGGGTIKALSDTNTILTDADALTVTGRADPIHIIQQLQAASAASAQALADVERAVTDI